MSKIQIRLLARAGKGPSWLSSDQNCSSTASGMCLIPGGGTKILQVVPQKTSTEVLCQGQGQKAEGEVAIHLVAFGLEKISHLFCFTWMNKEIV